MHRTGNTRQEWLTWIVQTNHFDPRAYFEIGFCKLAHRLRVDRHPPEKDSRLCEVYAWNLHFAPEGV